MANKGLRRWLEERGMWVRYRQKMCQSKRDGGDFGDSQYEALCEVMPLAEQAVPGDRPEEVGLFDPGTFNSGSVSTRRAVEWVAEHLHTKVQPSDAPDSKAWSMLQWARDERNVGDFWKNMLAKVTTGRAEGDARFQDDGRVLELVERVRAAARAAEKVAERVEAEDGE